MSWYQIVLLTEKDLRICPPKSKKKNLPKSANRFFYYTGLHPHVFMTLKYSGGNLGTLKGAVE